MKTIKLFSAIALMLTFASCETVQQITNTTTTGSVFSINGKWQLNATSENGLVNSIVTVTPFIQEGRLTTLANNNQCYRENDAKWKTIKANKSGGYTLQNSSSNCNSGTLTYNEAAINVVSNNEIKITGKNASGQELNENWIRVK